MYSSDDQLNISPKGFSELEKSKEERKKNELKICSYKGMLESSLKWKGMIEVYKIMCGMIKGELFLSSLLMRARGPPPDTDGNRFGPDKRKYCPMEYVIKFAEFIINGHSDGHGHEHR